MDIRRLNYILIRGDADTWETWSKRRFGRVVRWIFGPLLVLTPEGGAVAITTLLCGAAGVDVRFSNLYLVFCGLFGLLFAAWISRPIFARARGLEVRCHFPARVSAGERVVVTTELYNPLDRPLYTLRVQGPFLPWDGTWISRRPSVALLGPGERARVESTLVLTQRGQRPIGRFGAASVRPLGLMRGRLVRSAPVRLIVVPRTVTVEGLSPPPLIPADHAEQVRGQATGADFELAGVRPYRPGDRIRDLHARSWARLGEPMVRTFRRTARREAVIVLDATGGRIDEAAFEAAVSLTASLVRWAVGHGARTRLLIVSDRCREVAVGAQIAPVDLALDALAAVQPAATPPPDAPARAAALQVRGGTFLVHASWPPRWAAPIPTRQWVVAGRRARQAAQDAGIRDLGPADLAGQRIGLA